MKVNLLLYNLLSPFITIFYIFDFIYFLNIFAIGTPITSPITIWVILPGIESIAFAWLP